MGPACSVHGEKRNDLMKYFGRKARRKGTTRSMKEGNIKMNLRELG
jgi:hypothetical protein